MATFALAVSLGLAFALDFLGRLRCESIEPTLDDESLEAAGTAVASPE